MSFSTHSHYYTRILLEQIKSRLLFKT